MYFAYMAGDLGVGNAMTASYSNLATRWPPDPRV
jgi:hypothetical protein